VPGSTPAQAGPLDLDQLLALEAAATPGPWTFYAGTVWYGDVAAAPRRVDAGDEIAWPYADDAPSGPFDGNDPARTDDAALIAAARSAVPALLNEINQLRQRLSTRDAQIEDSTPNCPPCRWDQSPEAVSA
jgi:hypothetical protein